MIRCPMCDKPALEWASKYRLYLCTGCFNHFCRKEENTIIQKEKDRKYKITYDKGKNYYYIIYEGFPYHLNEEEVVFDENMTWEEASKYSHDLNTEIGLNIYYET